MRRPRPLELGHVPAVELEVARGRQRAAHVVREAQRHDAVLPAPHEQRGRLQPRQAGPEPLLAVRLLEVDVPRRRVERRAAARGQVRPQELVDAGGGPAVAGARDRAARPWPPRADRELRARAPARAAGRVQSGSRPLSRRARRCIESAARFRAPVTATRTRSSLLHLARHPELRKEALRCRGSRAPRRFSRPDGG